MVLRIWLFGMSSKLSTPPVKLAFAPPELGLYSSMSAFVIRPPSPVPVIQFKLYPFSFAKARANGLALESTPGFAADFSSATGALVITGAGALAATVATAGADAAGADGAGAGDGGGGAGGDAGGDGGY